MRKTEYVNRIINASDKDVLANLKNTISSNADNIYYNVRIFNDTLKEIPVVFYENRVQPILNNPSDYELTVVRFKLSTLGLPILIWASQPLMQVTLSNNGVDYTRPVLFIPNGTLGSIYGEAIFNFQEFIDMVNLALSNAFNDLKAAVPLSAPTTAPFLTIDHDTNIINLVVETVYATPPGAPPAATFVTKIYFNKNLYYFFPSFQTIATSNPIKTYEIVVKNNIINISTIGANTYYTMYGDFPVFALWNDYQSISFESNTIPVVPENQPSQANVINALVTDFEPLEQENNRTAFQYFPQGPLRYYSLASQFPLTQIDLRIFWQDKAGRSFPLYLPSGELCTVKILFRKKSTREFEDAFGTTLSLEDRR